MNIFKFLLWTTRLDKILEQVQKGDLVQFHRGLFLHHAVYVGRGRAVHHHLGPDDGEVIEVPLEYLAKGDLMKVFKVNDTPFTPREIVRRARERIGPLPYSLPDGNCEHFTSYVYHGVWESSQLSGFCQYELRLLRTVRHSRSGHVAEAKPRDLQKQDDKQSSSLQEDQQQRQKPLRVLFQLQQQTQDAAHDNLTEQNEYREDKHRKNCTKYMYISDKSSDEEDDGYVFVPPRPVKYRHTKNPARIACNHARSWLKVLAVQSVVCLATIPLYKCSLQADNLRSLGRQVRPRSKRRSQNHTEPSETTKASDPPA